MSAMSTLRMDVWKFSTVFLMVILIISWVWMMIAGIINDSAMDSVRNQQMTVRELTNKMVTLEMQVMDLQSRNKALNERIEAFNTLRQRDVEYLQSQINRGPIKAIR
jgi:FtsZ-binding cell division protein ZapB